MVFNEGNNKNKLILPIIRSENSSTRREDIEKFTKSYERALNRTEPVHWKNGQDKILTKSMINEILTGRLIAKNSHDVKKKHDDSPKLIFRFDQLDNIEFVVEGGNFQSEKFPKVIEEPIILPKISAHHEEEILCVPAEIEEKSVEPRKRTKHRCRKHRKHRESKEKLIESIEVDKTTDIPKEQMMLQIIPNESLEQINSNPLLARATPTKKGIALKNPETTKRAESVNTPQSSKLAYPHKIDKNMNAAKIHWNYAIYSTFATLRTTNIKNIDLSTITPAKTSLDEQYWAMLFRAHKIIEEIPDKLDTNDDNISNFEELLRTFPYIKDLHPIVRMHLASSARLESHPRGTVIFREKCTVESIYLVVLGWCVEHQRYYDSASKTFQERIVQVYTGGECIGGNYGNAMKRRNSTLTVLSHTLFLCFEKSDWLNSMKNIDSTYQTFNLLSDIDYFTLITPAELFKISGMCYESWAQKNEVILHAHEDVKSLYIISSGTVIVTLNVPFIKTVKDATAPHISASEFQVVPFSGQELKPNIDELVYVPHKIDPILPGSFFPPIIKDIRGAYKTYTFAAGEEGVNCLVFPMERIGKLFPDLIQNHLKSINRKIYPSDVQIRELQEHYLSTKGWRQDVGSSVSKALNYEIEIERATRIDSRITDGKPKNLLKTYKSQAL